MAKEKRDNRQNNKYSDSLPQERPQPHNLDAERAILASMLREPEPCIDIVIENISGSDAFYSHINREVFKAIEYLHSKTEQDIDLISVAHYLAGKDRLDDIDRYKLFQHKVRTNSKKRLNKAFYMLIPNSWWGSISIFLS